MQKRWAAQAEIAEIELREGLQAQLTAQLEAQMESELEVRR